MKVGVSVCQSVVCFFFVLLNEHLNYFVDFRAAFENDIAALKAWHMGGADLATPDYSGNTALTVVSLWSESIEQSDVWVCLFF